MTEMAANLQNCPQFFLLPIGQNIWGMSTNFPQFPEGRWGGGGGGWEYRKEKYSMAKYLSRLRLVLPEELCVRDIQYIHIFYIEEKSRDLSHRIIS
jgi:hypothetical protein